MPHELTILLYCNGSTVAGVSSCWVCSSGLFLVRVLITFPLGWGGLFAVMVMRKVGRLPVLFWSQVLALAFMVGCTFAPNLKTFTGELSCGYVALRSPQFWHSFPMLDRVLWVCPPSQD